MQIKNHKESHYGMDDHSPSTMLWPWHIHVFLACASCPTVSSAVMSSVQPSKTINKFWLGKYKYYSYRFSFQTAYMIYNLNIQSLQDNYWQWSVIMNNYWQWCFQTGFVHTDITKYPLYHYYCNNRAIYLGSVFCHYKHITKHQVL